MRILGYNTASGGIHPLIPSATFAKNDKKQNWIIFASIPTVVGIKKNKHNS
jgi:hypothetical protein